MPAISMGMPTGAYMKKLVDSPISCRALTPMRLPGAPMMERLPPKAAAKTRGIRRRLLEKPDSSAMPQTTGIRTAAVPVLERKPDMRPTMTMMAMISILSVFAKRVTRPPILLAMPVSKRAWPTTNMPTQRMTLLLTYPAKVAEVSSTPVRLRPRATMVAVRPSGIFSRIKLMMANARNSRVIVVGDISCSPFV